MTPSFKDVAAFVWSYWRQLPLRFGLIIFGVLLAVLVEVQIPARAADLVTRLESWFADAGAEEAVWRAAALLVGSFLLLSLIQQGYLRIWIRFAAEIMRRMVGDGFHRVQRFGTDWHANSFAGATVRRITRGMWAYDSFADLLVIDLGPNFTVLIGFSIAMFWRDPLLGIYFVTAVTLLLTLSISLSLRYVAPKNQLSNDADTALGGALADAVTCNTVVKAFGAEEREDARLDAAARHWQRRANVAWRRSLDSGAAQSLLIVVLLAGLLGCVLWLAGRGRADLEDLVFVLTTYFMVNGYLRNIGWQVRNLQRAANELDDLVEIAHTPPQIRDARGAVELAAGAGEIRYEGVRFGYANQPQPVFEAFDLRIEPGEKVALVGPSGSGKSTFVKLLQRLYDLDAGCIRIDGQDIAGVRQDSLRRQLAVVPQEPILFHRSLAENIAYGCPDADEAAIREAARQAHADTFIRRLPEGYDTLVGERGIKLSGGERQRVAIARAILSDAPVLILDEATSSLDSVTEHHIQEAIARATANRTSILIAHRLSTVRQCDRILVFDGGQVVEQGDHDRLMARPGGLYRRLFDMQSLGFVDVGQPDDTTMAAPGA